MKSKYFTATEITKRKHKESYHCVALKWNKDFVDCYVHGPDSDSSITRQDLYFDDYELSECEQEDVLHYFNLADLSVSKKLLDTEFDLLELKRDKEITLNAIKAASDENK